MSEPTQHADDVRQDLAELADIVRVLAANSPAWDMVVVRIDSLINRLIEPARSDGPAS